MILSLNSFNVLIFLLWVQCVVSEILAAMIMKSTVFLDVTLCGLEKA